MRVLDIRGIKIGAGRCKAIVSLMAAEASDLAAQVRRAAEAGADLVEWRADCLDEAAGIAEALDAARDLRAATELPVLFTFRSAGQGGQRSLPPERYRALVEAVIDTGCVDLVDLELGCGEALVRELAQRAHAAGLTVVVSHHDFAGTPGVDELTRILSLEAELGADIPKLATMAHEFADALRVMEATERAARHLGLPLLTMAMGEQGRLTRLAGEAWGNALSFCALGKASAPGQVALGNSLAVLEALHGAWAGTEA